MISDIQEGVIVGLIRLKPGIARKSITSEIIKVMRPDKEGIVRLCTYNQIQSVGNGRIKEYHNIA